MKNDIIILLILCSTSECLSMNFKENTQKNKALTNILITHQGSLEKSIFSNDARSIFSCLQQKNDTVIEIYDIEEEKKTKKISYEPISLNINFFLNKTLPYIAYLSIFKNNKYEEPRFSLYNYKTGKNYTCQAHNFSQIGAHFISSDDSFCLMPSSNKTSYRIFDLKNNTSQKFDFNDIIEGCTQSFDKQYLLFSVKNYGTYVHTVTTNSRNHLSSTQLLHITFNPTSTVCTFFESETDKLIVYNLEKQEIIKQLDCKKPINHLFFPNDHTILFSSDFITYSVWEISSKYKPIEIKLDGQNYERNYQHNQHPRFFHFQLWAQEQCVVYDIQNNIAHTLYNKGIGTQLIFNKNSTHAVLCTNEKTAAVYEVESKEDSFKAIKTITFENGSLNPTAYFTPCGNYVVILSRGNQPELIIYDVKNDTIIFKSPWIYLPYSSSIEFYQDDSIIFVIHDTTIMIYNYINNEKKEITAPKKIVHYTVKADLLSFSYESTTELLSLKHTTFEKCEKIQSKYYEKMVEEEFDTFVEYNTSDYYIFYDYNGNLIKKDKSTKSCIIA